ncbi:pyridoxal-dependent aspartate 1-decarboxylase PanP [Desulfobotulus mexicanus]|uniref:Putative pyridoxal-dependent aspartate 1-decarboxylase n=1 Tax=Desulfobotulus mexicanus TaxID=2586642 RepID=A0A5S5MD51_9BACT|nr:putative pyridoxal-dependent aspartate 1-decarboxylase [Desulfobotulus mexicanus]TYT73621.1 putative pyridoxal-dependent aspartate 1-decarboxylase [Desulfobotulus mexicanus]
MRQGLSFEAPSVRDGDWEQMLRLFIQPDTEADRAKLVGYMEQILFGLQEFLHNHVGVTEEIGLKELALGYMDSTICFEPEKKLPEVISDIIDRIAPQAVNVSSPYFVGHMTSAIPFFMVLFKAIVAALNQNVVKVETSKVVSIVERQVTARLHRLVYGMEPDFYEKYVQSTDATLGVFTEGGTAANLTALWVARNRLLGPREGFDGVEADGLAEAYRAYDIDRCVILVSRRGHYSMRKAVGVLGLGNRNLVTIDVDGENRICLPALRRKIAEYKADPRTRILAVVGIAGATETGTVDPLRKMGELCREAGIHFHVDAAWGGPTLMSDRYRHLMDGIELADSVTIDGHKQFYMPMTCGMVYFRDPFHLDAISYHANYIIRRGSVDLGIKTLAGTREANSLILDSAIKVMGRKGYGMLIDHGIDLARKLAEEIRKRDNLQLVTAPELNILTYRFCPTPLKEALLRSCGAERTRLNEKINDININIQRIQRESGKSFVSRTAIDKGVPGGGETVVLRVVLMNPLTSLSILKEILDEQEAIYREYYSSLDLQGTGV